MGLSIVTRTGLGRRRRHADTLAALRDEHARETADLHARIRRIQQEAGAKLADVLAERDRLQRRVLVLERQSVERGRTVDRLQRRIDAYERESGRQFRLIEKLQRDLLVARGLPPVDAEVTS